MVVQVAVAVKDVEGEAAGMAQQRAQAVKEFMRTNFSLEPITENSAYITYLIGHADEQRLPDLLRSLESNTAALGIADIQVCLSMTWLKAVLAHLVYNRCSPPVRWWLWRGGTHSLLCTCCARAVDFNVHWSMQIALTSLEEVFLNIAKQAEIESSGDKLVPVEVNAGRKLMVPIGQEQITDPADNVSYRLSWGQDPGGGLCVADIVPIVATPPATMTNS